MGTIDRRTSFSEAIMVEKAIMLATHGSIETAVEYMKDRGIPDDVASRVMSGPEFQRNNGDRRKRSRT